MARIIYKGAHDAVDVIDPDAGTLVATAERGKHTEVPDAIAADLLERDDWREAPTPKPDAKPDNSNTPDPAKKDGN